MDMIVAIVIFCAVFGVIYFDMADRRAAVLLGAAAILLSGMVSGFFSIGMAINSIYFETLALIFGMSAISSVLDRSGLFSLIATRTAKSASGNGWWVLVTFALMTYGLSLLVNNLAAMTVIVPVTLSVCLRMKINPVPLLIAEIIASNLGGASTMIGDFPNMIISAAGHLKFVDFISGMMVPCLVLLAAMLAYLQKNRSQFASGVETGVGAPSTHDDNDVDMDPYLLRVGLWVMGVALVGFVLSDVIGLRPGWVALTAGAVAIILAGLNEDKDWFVACGGQDIIFFAALFVMVGGLVAAGALEGLFNMIQSVGNGERVQTMLTLMWTAAFLTIFLNAGATTALFVPVVSGLDIAMVDSTVWWALSLGVLAGSSAALTGATAGPLTASYMERFVETHPESRAHLDSGQVLDFKGYLTWGLPMMGMFLLLSSFYIMITAR